MSTVPADIPKGGDMDGVGATGVGATGAKPGGMQGGRKKTAWMAHVKATMRAHKGMKLKQVLKMAKKTYKKSMRGGMPVITPGGYEGAGPATGGRRRKTRRSRRGGDE